ncbi:MAG: hypothetical protein LBL93_06850 [Ruminococcus sp.]|nr:hypothetical protein [Ruminococcus sp.]
MGLTTQRADTVGLTTQTADTVRLTAQRADTVGTDDNGNGEKILPLNLQKMLKLEI